MNNNTPISSLCDLIVATLEEHKAENISVIDLKDKSDIAEYMIIATGRSNKHVASTAEYVMEKIKENGCKYFVEGMQNSDWVLIDTLDIIIHLFSKEKRDYYSLEQLWQG